MTLEQLRAQFLTAKFSTDYDGFVWCEQHDGEDDQPLITSPECWQFTPLQLFDAWRDHLVSHHRDPS